MLRYELESTLHAALPDQPWATGKQPMRQYATVALWGGGLHSDGTAPRRLTARHSPSYDGSKLYHWVLAASLAAALGLRRAQGTRLQRGTSHALSHVSFPLARCARTGGMPPARHVEQAAAPAGDNRVGRSPTASPPDPRFLRGTATHDLRDRPVHCASTPRGQLPSRRSSVSGARSGTWHASSGDETQLRRRRG